MPGAKDIRLLQRVLDYRFQDRDLLLEALTHPSYAAENHGITRHNQRLEFLGDAVIQILVTTRLYREFKDAPEGKLTKLRAVMTRRPFLAGLARRLELGDYMRLGNGEAAAGGADRDSNLCDAFESLLGAMYLDSGGLSAPASLLGTFLNDAPDAEESLVMDNPKGQLQELTQQHFQERPQYRIEEESGPDHAKTFVVAALLGDREIGRGTARRRQQAEQMAAREALRQLQSGGDGALQEANNGA